MEVNFWILHVFDVLDQDIDCDEDGVEDEDEEDNDVVDIHNVVPPLLVGQVHKTDKNPRKN